MDNLTTYNGGKNGSGTYQQIINLMPPHDIYIEGFLGSGAILRRKKPASINMGFDIDRSVTETYAGFPLCTIINMDAILYLEYYTVLEHVFEKYGEKVFIYLDPPYLMETRTSQKKIYKHEMTVQDHERLLEAISSIKNSYVMVSAYENPLYNKVLQGWHTHSFSSQTRNGPRTETLYMNYPTPTELHDYGYIGNDYRERERLQGIKSRLLNRFERMPELEKNFLLNFIKTM